MGPSGRPASPELHQLSLCSLHRCNIPLPCCHVFTPPGSLCPPALLLQQAQPPTLLLQQLELVLGLWGGGARGISTPVPGFSRGALGHTTRSPFWLQSPALSQCCLPASPMAPLRPSLGSVTFLPLGPASPPGPDSDPELDLVCMPLQIQPTCRRPALGGSDPPAAPAPPSPARPRPPLPA